jgi:Tfp pilus assembly major pilin PilA
MLYRHKQSGVTFWGFAMVAFLIVFFTLLTLKLVPPYIENAKVRTALENVVKQPNAANMSKVEIVDALQRRFDVDDVSRANLKTDLTVTKSADGRSTKLRIAYEVRIPLAYNISALLNFDENAEAR